MCRGARDVHDRQALDVGLVHLRGVASSAATFRSRTASTSTNTLGEKFCVGGPLEEQDVPGVPGGGDGGDREVTVILVGIVLMVDEDEVRFHGLDDPLDALNAVPVQRDGRIRIVAPKELGGLEDVAAASCSLRGWRPPRSRRRRS